MATLPILPNLGSGSFESGSLPVEPTTTTVDVTISPAVSITVGNTYAIVVWGEDGSETVHASITQDTAAGYAGGTRCHSTEDGGDGTWTSVAIRDMCFTTFEGATPKDTFTTTDAVVDLWPTYYFAQVFTATSSYTLDKIQFTCSKSTSGDPGTVNVYIRAASDAPSKASNPSPADASGPGIDFSTATLSWTGDGDTYDVYGGAGGNFVKLADGISETSYTLSTVDKLLFQDGVATWRVDSINAVGTTTGDDWTFDPRPAKVTNPDPADESTDKSIYESLSWDASTYATGYDVWLNGSRHYYDTSEVEVWPLATALPLDYETEQTWRVDARNEYGATTGDTWTFTTLAWDPPHVTVRLLSDGSETVGPFDPATMFITGENFMAGMRRLLLFCGASMWYESVDETDP